MHDRPHPPCRVLPLLALPDRVVGGMSTPEGLVVRAIRDYLAIRHIDAWRINTMGVWDAKRKAYRTNAGTNGVADILGVLPGGRFLAIECKAGRGKLSPAQVEFQRSVIRAGGLHIVAYRVEDVIEVLEAEGF